MRRLKDFIFVLGRCGREKPEKLGEIRAYHRGNSQEEPSGDTQWLSSNICCNSVSMRAGIFVSLIHWWTRKHLELCLAQCRHLIDACWRNERMDEGMVSKIFQHSAWNSLWYGNQTNPKKKKRRRRGQIYYIPKIFMIQGVLWEYWGWISHLVIWCRIETVYVVELVQWRKEPWVWDDCKTKL